MISPLEADVLRRHGRRNTEREDHGHQNAFHISYNDRPATFKQRFPDLQRVPNPAGKRLGQRRQEVLDQPIAETEAEKDQNAEKKKKKKDKVRSAWISFVGRIIAQFVGAVATVALGVVVLHTYAAPDSPAPSREETGAVPQVVPVSYPRPDGEVSLAVLPLENYSPGVERGSFADGMTEELITVLSKVENLRVISRTSTMQFKGQRKSLREISRQLGVQWIVEGSIARVGKRVRITAQLINADTDLHLWAESYDRPITDVLDLQADAAAVISEAITAVLLSQ